ncbi:hypothetical protein BDW59DRAFT_162167 [Aspergillus cavernicola]|uniref:DUF7732 domain-containing protein n=1 Tax=Aspergillus cavernicola TaxID=176166 RepID=A0ABR4ID03_9EURO
MKFALATTITLLLSSAVTSLSVPASDLAIRHGDVISASPKVAELDERDLEGRDLEKRRGGGGGGGRGGSGGGGGGSSGGSRPGSTSSSSNTGGYSSSGSGPRPTYGRGGGYYGGGSTSPYQSGSRSPLGLAPFFLPIAALAFFPGLWLSGAHIYPFHNPYRYTNNTNHRNESIPVICLCEQYAVCGCEDNNNNTYYESLFDGTQPKNTSIVRVTDVNGTQTIAINGTLPNGTTAVNSELSSAAALTLMQASGFWVLAAMVASAMYTL